MQTGLDPEYQEIFYENLPYRPHGLMPASKLPITSVNGYLVAWCGRI